MNHPRWDFRPHSVDWSQGWHDARSIIFTFTGMNSIDFRGEASRDRLASRRLYSFPVEPRQALDYIDGAWEAFEVMLP